MPNPPENPLNTAPAQPLELRVSWAQRGSAIAAVIVAGTFFPYKLWLGLQNNPSYWPWWRIVVAVGFTYFIFRWIYDGACRMWRETGLYLRADEAGIVVQTRAGRKEAGWPEVYSITRDDKSSGGEPGNWVTLRGKDNEVLVQWNSDWANFTGKQIKLAGEFEVFAERKLREMKRFRSLDSIALEEWETTHAISGVTKLQVKTNFGCIGWVGLVFFTRCAFFSWNAQTGGPVVGSLFLLFAVLSAYILAAAATLTVDETAVESHSLFGTYRILWDEVTSMAVDRQGNNMTFIGEGKRLAFAGPTMWGASGRQEMLQFLAAQRAKRGIAYDDRAGRTWGLSKNVRVRR